MKRVQRILPFFVLVYTASGQGWEITLRSGEDLTHQELQWVKGDSLVVHGYNTPGGSPAAIPLHDILLLRRVTNGGPRVVRRGAAIVAGGVIGYGAGHLFYRIALPWISNGDDSGGGPELKNVFIYASALVGAMHGGNWPFNGASDTVAYDLSRMSPSETIETARRLVTAEEAGFLERIGEKGSRLLGLPWYKWEVTLTSGQVYPRARLAGMAGDSLRFTVGSRSFSVPAGVVRRITRRAVWREYGAPVVGAMVGLYGGAVVGRVMSDRILELPPGSPVTPFPMAVGAVLGAVVGSGYAQRSQVTYDLSGLTGEQKAGAIRTFIVSGP
ncbi:MAG: hypothetical protein ACE5LH_00920 [Fidelibacterota bacterium]